MRVFLHKQFLKKYQKLPKALQNTFTERTHLLLNDPTSPLLRIHALKGSLEPHKSMNVSGDYRALFIVDEVKQTITFLKIGTHSELYF